MATVRQTATSTITPIPIFFNWEGRSVFALRPRLRLDGMDFFFPAAFPADAFFPAPAVFREAVFLLVIDITEHPVTDQNIQGPFYLNILKKLG
jgi:hypothetical protein